MRTLSVALLGAAIFMAGSAFREAWTDAGWPMTPDHGFMDLEAAAFLLLWGTFIARKARKS